METILSLNEALDTATFYGVNNLNIMCLKNQHPDVRVVARGYQVKVIGSQPAITRFEQNLRKCEAFCIKNILMFNIPFFCDCHRLPTEE